MLLDVFPRPYHHPAPVRPDRLRHLCRHNGHCVSARSRRVSSCLTRVRPRKVEWRSSTRLRLRSRITSSRRTNATRKMHRKVGIASNPQNAPTMSPANRAFSPNPSIARMKAENTMAMIQETSRKISCWDVLRMIFISQCYAGRDIGSTHCLACIHAQLGCGR